MTQDEVFLFLFLFKWWAILFHWFLAFCLLFCDRAGQIHSLVILPVECDYGCKFFPVECELQRYVPFCNWRNSSHIWHLHAFFAGVLPFPGLLVMPRAVLTTWIAKWRHEEPSTATYQNTTCLGKFEQEITFSFIIPLKYWTSFVLIC